MAPSTDLSVLLIFPFPHFQAVLDGQPLIGGKLYSFAAGTSTPKSTTADRWGTVANPNPLTLDDQGAGTVWLQGYYNLRLYTAEDVLVWSIDNYTWESAAPPPEPGEKIVGSSDAIVDAVPGAGVISVPNLVPVGYRCEGLVWEILTGFGSSQGMNATLIGDGIANDRWSHITNLSTGQVGGQMSFRSDVTPIEPIPYVLLLSSLNGLFDSVGRIGIRAFWSALPPYTP